MVVYGKASSMTNILCPLLIFVLTMVHVHVHVNACHVHVHVCQLVVGNFSVVNGYNDILYLFSVELEKFKEINSEWKSQVS